MDASPVTCDGQPSFLGLRMEPTRLLEAWALLEIQLHVAGELSLSFEPVLDFVTV